MTDASVASGPLTGPSALGLDQLRTRTSAKWQRYAADVLPLWVAEMDVELAPVVRDRLARAVAEGDTGYKAGRVYENAFVEYAQRWNWPTLDESHVLGVTDVITGYTQIIAELTEPGASVIVTPPVYPPFYKPNEATGRVVVECPLGDGLRLDLAALEDAFRDETADGRAAAFLLCNPHNPGGTLHTRAELEGVAALARQYGVRVVSDEIHAPLVHGDGEFVPYLSVAGGEDGFALMSASKAWNLAGLPGALLIAGTDATADLKHFVSVPRHGPSAWGALAQTAAYQEGQPWLDSLLHDLASNRALLASLVAEQLPGVRLTAGSATFLAWLDFSGIDLNGEDPSAYLEREARVALNSGPTFGAGGAGHARINFATTPAILSEAISRIAASLP